MSDPYVSIRDVDRECERLAGEQHGILSRAQARAFGLSWRAIDRRIASGRWTLVHRGVYALGARPLSWRGRLIAAGLCGGTTALASHRAAAYLLELDGVEEPSIEISVTAGRQIRGVVVHRRLPMDNPGRVHRFGIPATPIDRTLLDLAAVAPRRGTGLALDDALRRRLTTFDSLRCVISQSRGRPGAQALHQLVDLRDRREALMQSRLESALLRVLRRHGLPLPAAQYPVRQGEKVVARLDFAYPAYRLGIEADGYRWHGGRERWRHDLRRENRLKLMGWTLLRFSWEDVHDHSEIVADQIRAALDRSGVSQLPTISVVNEET